MKKQPIKHERRASNSNLEVRSESDGTRTLSGVCVVYNTLSQDMGGWFEKIAPGAFSESLAQRSQAVLFSHDDSKVLGKVKAGTTSFEDSHTVLRYSCKLGNSSLANDVVDMVSRGDIESNSFGFSVLEDDWSNEGGKVTRVVRKGIIYEASPVLYPAYETPQNVVNVRAALRSCPAELRSQISKRGYDDSPDLGGGEGILDDGFDVTGTDADVEMCSCACAACRSQQCDRCSEDRCSKDRCTNCPQAEDETRDAKRMDALRIRSLFAHRRRVSGL
jgi:HK97 family phage prohead protease